MYTVYIYMYTVDAANFAALTIIDYQVKMMSG